MMRTSIRAQRGYAVLPMVLVAVGAIAATVVVSSSIVRALVLGEANAKARALTDAALAANANHLGSNVSYSDSGVAILPAAQSATFSPAGGGQLPAGAMVPTSLDGWGRSIGYCTLAGVTSTDGTAALVSAGKDGVFQSDCAQAVNGVPAGDDIVRVINSASLLKGRTGSIHHGKAVASISALNSLQYIASGEIRPVLDDGSGRAGLFINPSGQAGKWVALQSQGNQISSLYKGLVGYWPMDEVAGFKAYDAVAGRDLLFSNSGQTPGMFSGARLVNGSAAVSFPEVQASGTAQATIGVWLDSATITTLNPMILSFGYYDIIVARGYIGFNTLSDEIRGIPIPPGRHFYVFVMDTRRNVGDTLAPDERIYVDGVKQALLLNGTATSPSNRVFTGAIYLGRDASGTYPLPNTFYDDFAIWKRALADDEVNQLWQSGRSLGELITISAGFVQRNGAWQPIAETPYPMCLDYRNKGAMADGVYLIAPPGTSAPFQVRCDMTRDGGGWTVFQRRFSGGISFYRSWSDYVAGFGPLTGEFWLGLDKLNLLTSMTRSLRVDLGRYTGEVSYAKYGAFAVGSGATNYRVSVSAFDPSSPAGDAMAWHDGQQFSTFDANHQANQSTSCAQVYRGAWWYNYCHSSNLNGAWLNGPHSTYADGVEWDAWTGGYESLVYTEMKVR